MKGYIEVENVSLRLWNGQTLAGNKQQLSSYYRALNFRPRFPQLSRQRIGPEENPIWKGQFMVSKCAAPDCSERFRYLHSGRLYQFDTRERPQNVSDRMPVQAVEFFWLCDGCASRFRLVYDPALGVRVVPFTRIGMGAS